MNTTNIRKRILKSIYAAGSGHPGGSLSCVEILAAVYEHARPQPYDPTNPQRDIVILSKGHAAPALYSVFVELGIMTEAEAMGLRKLGQKAQGHPARQWLPAVETSTGSLGQGLAVAVGMAKALKPQGRRVYCIVGDGDLQEGIAYEACRIAGYWGLDNLGVVLDANGKASDRHSQMLASTTGYDTSEMFRALKWYTFFCNGHRVDNIRECLNRAFGRGRGHPKFIHAQTIKGRGVPWMEQDPDGAHGSLTLSDEDLARALEVLGDVP